MVNNIINARLNKVSKKAVREDKSVELWVEHLTDNDYDTFFYEAPYKGPFIISWVSKWQRVVST